MNDYEKRLAEFCGVEDVGDVSDGYHTFNQLYHQRAMLFAVIVNQNKKLAWKTRKHEDGEPCFGGGWFLVTIDTPDGAYGYHYEDKYWDLFECKEIPVAKHWDGYTEENVDRLLSLPSKKIEFVSYDGRYPNLCGGTLVLRLGSKEYSMDYVLSSGGGCYCGGVERGCWEIKEYALPEELLPYIDEIKEVVNENVEHGCCGGCL